ncbi:hypothetical protein AYL99_11922 [Fonsecaea erecta]|uniref:DNA2/NAM7 helicase helicase domain-containing protein n=1 Tax=Fonsecaea erecta TaxID=1367422 RepID=A0A178Z2A8_9EURO|nr:hypothetical protein AYL99_11922 [Fonsecaea erecta]OAP53900.1 hypothetical protein AYL99_11922 [Fonsecaea erecta]
MAIPNDSRLCTPLAIGKISNPWRLNIWRKKASDLKWLGALVHQEKQNTANFWKCRVAPLVPNGSADRIPVFFTKLWDKETETFDDYLIRVANTNDAAEYDFRRVIRSVKPHLVKFQIIDSTRQDKRNPVSLERLNFAAKNKVYTAWNELWKRVISFNNLYEIKSQDTFAGIRDQVRNPEQYMRLNTQQAQGMTAARDAKGAILLVEGAPGAGKSHFNYQFIKSSNSRPILSTASSNDAIDVLVRSTATKAKRFIRLYSNTAEKSIRSRHIRVTLEKDANARPDIESAEDIIEMSNIESIIRKLFDIERAHTFFSIFDRRVKDLTFALGEALLQETGIIHDPAYTPADAGM